MLEMQHVLTPGAPGAPSGARVRALCSSSHPDVAAGSALSSWGGLCGALLLLRGTLRAFACAQFDPCRTSPPYKVHTLLHTQSLSPASKQP